MIGGDRRMGGGTITPSELIADQIGGGKALYDTDSATLAANLT